VGSGAIISADGLILTVGYLIMESTEVQVLLADGSVVEGKAVGLDWETGFGLVKIAVAARLPPLEIGDSAALKSGAGVNVVTRMGDLAIAQAQVAARREFAGYWEYLLPEAIFTQPPVRGWGGAVLLSPDGRLLGIGSLFVRNAADAKADSPGNMFIPIEALKPVLGDLLAYGARQDRDRAWIGVTTNEEEGRLFVVGLTREAPAQKGGLRRGDEIVAVAGRRIAGQADFYKKLWEHGAPGAALTLRVRRDDGEVDLSISPIGRKQWIKPPEVK
jgi:S1-C subfamily serine protease